MFPCVGRQPDQAARVVHREIEQREERTRERERRENEERREGRERGDKINR